MAKEHENFNSLNEETFINELKDLDEDARVERIREIVKKHNTIGDANRQLYERAKKSEGELKELKVEKEKPEDKKTVKPDEDILKRLDNLALKAAGINEADEVELFDKWKTDTGRDSDSIVDNSIFKKELDELRTAKANLKASSNIKGEGGEGSGIRNTPDYWIAKATKDKDGKLLFDDATPKELYSQILNKLAESSGESSETLRFYNQ